MNVQNLAFREALTASQQSWHLESVTVSASRAFANADVI